MCRSVFRWFLTLNIRSVCQCVCIVVVLSSVVFVFGRGLGRNDDRISKPSSSFSARPEKARFVHFDPDALQVPVICAGRTYETVVEDTEIESPPRSCTGWEDGVKLVEGGAVQIPKDFLGNATVTVCAFHDLRSSSFKDPKFNVVISDAKKLAAPIKINFERMSVTCRNGRDVQAQRVQRLEYVARALPASIVTSAGNGGGGGGGGGGADGDGVDGVDDMNTSLGYNVIIVHVDQSSKYLPASVDFLNSLRGVRLASYERVAAGLPGTLLPLLTGRKEAALPPALRNRHFASADAFPLVWNKFQHKGYSSLYASTEREDFFSSRFNGFHEEPTDFFLRKFWHDVSDNEGFRDAECVSGLHRYEHVLRYATSFLGAAPRRPKVAVLHLASALPKRLDRRLADWLRASHERNLLANAVVLLSADARAAQLAAAGRAERRSPLMSIVLPTDFASVYRSRLATLLTNSARLTTPLDVHDTLLDLLDRTRVLDTSRLAAPPHDARQSLFLEVPRNRTCKSAAVDLHECACVHWMTLRTDDAKVKAAGLAIAEHANAAIRQSEQARSSCAQLSIAAVSEASLIFPNEKVWYEHGKFFRANELQPVDPDLFRKSVVQLTVSLQPGGQLVSGTVHYDQDSRTLGVAGRLVRHDYVRQGCHARLDADSADFCACIA